jgi:hypothetical protein
MTKTYNLAPEPRWIIINNEGTVAGGAKMYTRRSDNWDIPKAVYQTPDTSTPWTNPIIFDLNGVEGPFYWEYDSDFPDELYYIYVEDKDGNLLWSMNGFSGGSGGGGGGNVTTYLPLVNYINNNQFIDHIKDTVTTSQTNLVIAPSNHKGFTPADINPVTQTWGTVGSDIRFLKNSTANTDNISFPVFALGTAPLLPDVTPADYLRYVCTTNNLGETYKCFQFPITQKVKNLSNQIMTFKVWARSATPDDIEIYVRQYFGSGPGVSLEVRDQIGTMSLTSTWTRQYFQFTVPNVAAKTLGSVGSQTDDDALYIQIQMPLNQACDISFVKPALYLGDIEPPIDYENYDQISAITYTARTGDVRVGYSPVAPRGWVTMNDGTIGNDGSLATNFASASAFQLYATLYTAISDTYAPVSGGRTAPGNTMANAVADFVANKTLTLPRSLGRVLAATGAGSGLTARALGEYLGEEAHLMTLDELVQHNHNPLSPANRFVTGGTGSSNLTGGSDLGTSLTTGGVSGATVPNNAFNIMQPTSFMNFYIKL